MKSPLSFFRAASVASAAVLVAHVAQAYSVFGRTWPAGDIPMHLQLGAATSLSDGAASWGAVAESALGEWNAQIVRSQFTVVRDSTAAQASGNRINNVFFSPTVYGDAWGSGVLAVTLTRSTSRNTSEADVLFNGNRTWDSYRGALRRNGAMDFRRVALHEFGHVLGLGHPDQATPPQTVSAVMNSIVSNLETLQADDIAGARSLYEGTAASASPPVIVTQPASAALATTASFTLNVVASGTGPFTYAWTFRPAGSNTSEPFRLATGPTYTIGSVQPADAGTYTASVSNAFGTVTSNSATVSVASLATAADTTVANISTRGFVGTDDSILIAGLVISGSTAKSVLVRAVGPGLAAYGVAGTLADPVLTVLDKNQRVVAQNDNWGGDAQIAAASARLGAFELTGSSRDSALLLTLPPGTYTAQVSGLNRTTGVALVEAYDADADAATSRTRRLLNISTRGYVGTGDNALIAGLVVNGPGPRTYLVRAVGPTLANYGVSGALDDPFLQIYQGETLLHENNDWDSPSSGQAALRSAATTVGAFPLAVRRDAALLMTLQPGAYTAKVTGFGNTTGVGLIEIYEMP